MDFSVTEKVGTHAVAPAKKETSEGEDEDDDDDLNIDDIWASTQSWRITHSTKSEVVPPNVEPRVLTIRLLAW